MWNDFDNEMNLYLRLALIVMDDWTVNSAEFVSLSLQNQKRNQQALAELLGISQSSVSERQNVLICLKSWMLKCIFEVKF